jgi:hypothetical protein
MDDAPTAPNFPPNLIRFTRRPTGAMSLAHEISGLAHIRAGDANDNDCPRRPNDRQR